jgi:LPXTG-site transpeptidase (sortase) family protein
VDNYLNNLGHRLSAHAPGYQFQYTYTGVNDRAINAFALPGGHIYINRGTIEAADNEAQLAAVMAHETSHVALRHGTNQASKASAAQLPLGILGALLGNNSTGAALAQLGAGFTLNSLLLKYSREDESQADIMGTQILYDSGYDPRCMGQFLEKIQALDQGNHRVAFFADHPSPDGRVARVAEEVDKLGGARSGSKTNSREFDRDTFFRPLHDIRLGDEIKFTTPARSFEYIVESIEVVAPNDIQVLEPSTGRELTFVTCFPFHFVGPAPKRFVVRAHEVDGTSSKQLAEE